SNSSASERRTRVRTWPALAIAIAGISNASQEQTRRILTDYRLYAKMIPYIEKAEFNTASHILHVEGGIWKWKLRSEILFEEQPGGGWVKFRIVGGHFMGLSGEFIFESAGERGTTVYFAGEQTGLHWPPQFVIERGAEIVFGFTASRMRSYVESQKQQPPPTEQGPNEIPQPRSHL
ncbi:MAG: hypothetical protein ACXVBC_13095, partial [Bdellovibrionota bacterium]